MGFGLAYKYPKRVTKLGGGEAGLIFRERMNNKREIKQHIHK
jgi:hypothetical protein